MSTRTLDPLIPNPLGLAFVVSRTFQVKMARECMGRGFGRENQWDTEPRGPKAVSRLPVRVHNAMRASRIPITSRRALPADPAATPLPRSQTESTHLQ